MRTLGPNRFYDPSKRLLRVSSPGDRASLEPPGIESPDYPRLQLIHSAAPKEGVAAERNGGERSAVWLALHLPSY